ncbi:MAG: hypothetical protein ACO29Z_08270, partial [Crocinitomicaceae bacterium]
MDWLKLARMLLHGTVVCKKSVPKATKQSFKHLIAIAPKGFEPRRQAPKRHSSMAWKERAIYAMRRRFYFQVLKSNVKFKQKWWNNYCITRIGAPCPGEFLCPETFYVAEISKIADAHKFRQYWYWCRRKSFEILEWLWNLKTENYCIQLHEYLNAFIVTKRPILSEIRRYDSKS